MYIHAPNQTPVEFPYSFAKLKQAYPGTMFPVRPTAAMLREYDVYLVIDDKPEHDPKKQKLVQRHMSDFVFEDNKFYTVYDVVGLTEAEFNARQPSEDRISRAAEIKILKKQFEAMTVPEEEINDYASLFPPFRVGESVSIGDKRQYEGEVWQVIQAHTTQIDWLPPDVPALWKRVYDPETIQLWVQPTGAHDAYNTGDKVYWPDETTTWESTIEANTTVPGENLAHGYWVEV